MPSDLINMERVSCAIDLLWRQAPSTRACLSGSVSFLVRRALLGYGLGKTNPDAPLADIIRPGQYVLLKPNWVTDRNAGHGGIDCLYTSPAFVRAVLEEVLAARPGKVTLGDSPIQSCVFDRIVTTQFRRELQELCKARGVVFELVDFRRIVMVLGPLRAEVEANLRETSRYVLFDLAADSLLEPLCKGGAAFRVGDYDPRELARTHLAGRHQYLLCREAFEADVVISLPKLKTHCKAGLTGALKNLVGLNGNKDYLPHYRAGGSRQGGDNYEGSSLGRDLSARFDDLANQRMNRADYPLWKNTARLLRFSCGRAAGTGGGWHGNDTVWRMVLDLNRILLYGREDASLSDSPQRVFYSLTDAIVCGEGDGPLRPEVCQVGAVTFGASPLACDLVHASLLRLDARCIPLLREATGRFRWPLAQESFVPEVVMNGERTTLEGLARRFGVDAKVPAGWRSQLEWTSVRNHPALTA